MLQILKIYNKIFHLQCTCICLAPNGCCYPVLYGVVKIYVHDASDRTWVNRVQSPSEDPVSCFGGVPVSWLYLLYFMI
jgi:hypothetical protein